jgi:Sulfite exporter TauE/SafE
VAPFIIGGIIGVPLGAVLLTYLNPGHVRLGVGVLLVIYSIYGLAKPAFKPHKVGAAVDGGIGLLNGVLGGLTGLPGFIITVWCQMRDWTKDEQRAVFQPVILTGMMMIAISLGVAGAVTTDTLKLYVLGLPALLAGLWVGFKCYGKLDDATFRKVVLLLLLCAGLALIAAQRWPLARPSSGGIMSSLVSPASAAPVCRPVLSITRQALSAINPASMERRWTATISADASTCASKAGYFELGLLREKENSLPLEFREQFIWVEPSSPVSIDVWADEAIERAWVDSIQPCGCADASRRR